MIIHCTRSSGLLPQRGRKVIAQGNALGIGGPESFQALKGRNPSARQPIRYRTQGGATLCPGLSHFAPLGQWAFDG